MSLMTWEILPIFLLLVRVLFLFVRALLFVGFLKKLISFEVGKRVCLARAYACSFYLLIPKSSGVLWLLFLPL